MHVECAVWMALKSFASAVPSFLAIHFLALFISSFYLSKLTMMMLATVNLTISVIPGSFFVGCIGPYKLWNWLASCVLSAGIKTLEKL